MATTGNTEKSNAGSPAYICPECLDGGQAYLSPMQDVWTIGLIFYAMIYGTLPFFSDESEQDLYFKICKQEVKFDDSIPITPEGRKVISDFLEKDPDKRLPLDDFLEMPYNQWDEEEFTERYEKAVADNKKRIEEAEQYAQSKQAEREREKHIEMMNRLEMLSMDTSSKTYGKVNKKTSSKRTTSPRGARTSTKKKTAK